MDPVTAFSLACGVIQIVDFGTKAVTICKEVYERGASAENEDIEVTIMHLTDLQSTVTPSAVSRSSGSGASPQEQNLLKVCKDCSTTAREMVHKLQGLAVSKPRSKRQVIKIGVKSILERNTITSLQHKLDLYKAALDTHILIDLRTQFDLSTLQMADGFRHLDQKVQTLVVQLSRGQKNFDEIKVQIHDESEQTREHLTNLFQQQLRLQESREYRKCLLDKLWFAEIPSREERIIDAHAKTFEWIFERPSSVSMWSSFVTWLEDENGIYWIHGKAGAGKSTLMSFLCNDARTQEHLKVWSTSRLLLTPRFYFWSGGTQLERSIEGLLRSLIWQLVGEIPELPDQLFEQGAINAWTERRLKNLFKHVVQRVRRTHALCYFIDGLDEYEGDQDGLVDLIHEMSQNMGVKICLSSRPHRAFIEAFGSYAQLRLQDLTSSDILQYLLDKLQNPKDRPQRLTRENIPRVMSEEHQWSSSSSMSYPLEEIAAQILKRAEGVFLWVTLAVKDQLRGIRNDDSCQQLRDRLDALPDEVEKIYSRMLCQVDRTYRKEAAMFLQIALGCLRTLGYARSGRPQGICRHLLAYTLALHPNLDNMLGSTDKTPEPDLVAMSSKARHRIALTCEGMLEIDDRRRATSGGPRLPRDSSDGSSDASNFDRDGTDRAKRSLISVSESSCTVTMNQNLSKTYT